MRLLVDEDTGSGIGKALYHLGIDVLYFGNSKHLRLRCGTPDCEWLAIAGSEDRLVLSRNSAMLQNEAELEVIVASAVGIVLLPQHIDRMALFRLIIKKWDWLSAIHSTETRPFAFSIGQSGRVRRMPLPVEAEIPVAVGSESISTTQSDIATALPSVALKGSIEASLSGGIGGQVDRAATQIDRQPAPN